MLRAPCSAYTRARSHDLLKVKTFHDIEATVVGHEPGKGKHEGRLGAYLATLDNGTPVFGIGTGMTDVERANPAPVGAKVTVRYQELTNDGVPRFPVFVGVRDYE